MAGNGDELYVRLDKIESDVARNSHRLHVVERDICNHAVESAEESRRTGEKVDALAREFSRFAASVAESINALREEMAGRPLPRRWLERWLG